MAHVISERSATALLTLFPGARGRADAPSWLVDQLVDAELHRRGFPDAVSGAFHALALQEGPLLKEEYDLSTHGHADGWVLGAVLVDPLQFTVFNMQHGLPAGDAALKAMVDAMKSVCPRAKVVRIHTDGFAVLLGPTADQPLTDALVPTMREALATKLPDLKFTLGALELTVVDPPNWQVLGPLAWAECERALTIARRGGRSAVQRRRVVLDGRLPSFD
jgi:GGDEF domain-containing protein